MREFKEIHAETLSEAKKDNGFVGTVDKMNYAVKIDGFDSSRMKGANFGVLVDLNRPLKAFKVEAKKAYVDSKGKATLASVKAWIKENKPSQFFAKWKPDSTNYKDDSVEIFYTK